MNQRKKNVPRRAKASLTCGLLGASILPLVAAIPAIMLGHKAAHDIKTSNGELDGEGLALGGLILGYLGVVYGIGMLLMIPYLDAQRKKNLDQTEAIATEAAATKQIAELAQACLTFAENNNGFLPKTIQEAAPQRDNWISPFDPNTPVTQPSYRLLYPGRALASFPNPESVRLLEDRYKSWNGRRAITYVDGRTEWIQD